MNRLAATISAFTLLSIGTVATASALAPPEVDEANATIQMKPTTPFKAVQCAGEDGIPYITFRGGWTGFENETTPGFTDYNLSGPITVKGVVWTINLKTGRGVLTGKATFSSPVAGTTTYQQAYAGSFTLITQGLPGSSTGASVPARGWISAATDTAGVADGGSLLANDEFQILPGFAAVGQFGDANPPLGIPDYAVTTANQAC